VPEEIRERVVHGAASAETHEAGCRTVTCVEVTHDTDPADHVCETVYLLLIREGDTLRVELDRHTHGVFELDEFLAAVRAAGFDATAEPWELSAWQPDEVPMPLIVGVLRG
jgi:hypothetical protein